MRIIAKLKRLWSYLVPKCNCNDPKFCVRNKILFCSDCNKPAYWDAREVPAKGDKA